MISYRLVTCGNARKVAVLGIVLERGQGFCNTVLKAEFGMRGYVVSDYNSSRLYMSPIQGVLNGNDLPDGQTSGWAGGRDYDGNNIKFEDYVFLFYPFSPSPSLLWGISSGCGLSVPAVGCFFFI